MAWFRIVAGDFAGKEFPNGITSTVLDPQQLAESLSRAGFDISRWYNKANRFTWNRGTTPSMGWFLVSGSSLDGPQQVTLEIVASSPSRGGFAPAPIVFRKLKVAKAISVWATAQDPDADIQLIQLVDETVASWEREFVGADYNKVLSVDNNREVVYDKTTLKKEEGQSSGENPWTWKQIFEDLVPDIQTDDAELPQTTPQMLLFEQKSKKYALDRLLFYTGHTILRDQNGMFSLVKIGNSTDSFAEFTAYTSQLLADSDWEQTGEEGLLIPDQLLFSFPRIGVGGNLGEKTTNVVAAKVANVKTTPGSQLRIRGFQVDGDRIPSGQSQVLTTEANARGKDIYESLSARENPQVLTFNSFPNIKPTKNTAQVEFYHYDKQGPMTLVRSCVDTTYPMYQEERRSREFSGFARVVSQGEQGPEGFTYNINNIRLFSGELDDVADNSDRLNNVPPLFRNQTISQGDEVVVVFDQSNGDYRIFKPGGAGGVDIVKFALTQNMAMSQDEAEARVLPFGATIETSQDGLDLVGPDSDSQKCIVLNPDNRFFGAATNFEGGVDGYPYLPHTGMGIFAGTREVSTENPQDPDETEDIPLYEIISMENYILFAMVKISGIYDKENGTPCKFVTSGLTFDGQIGHGFVNRRFNILETGDDSVFIGSNPRPREGDEGTDLIVKDPADIAGNAREGMRFIIAINSIADTTPAPVTAVFWSQVDVFIKVQGRTTSTVTDDMETFELGNIEVCQGTYPGETVEVDNSAERSFNNDEQLTVSYNNKTNTWNVDNDKLVQVGVITSQPGFSAIFDGQEAPELNAFEPLVAPLIEDLDEDGERTGDYSVFGDFERWQYVFTTPLEAVFDGGRIVVAVDKVIVAADCRTIPMWAVQDQ